MISFPLFFNLESRAIEAPVGAREDLKVEVDAAGVDAELLVEHVAEAGGELLVDTGVEAADAADADERDGLGGVAHGAGGELGEGGHAVRDGLPDHVSEDLGPLLHDGLLLGLSKLDRNTDVSARHCLKIIIMNVVVNDCLIDKKIITFLDYFIVFIVFCIFPYISEKFLESLYIIYIYSRSHFFPKYIFTLFDLNCFFFHNSSFHFVKKQLIKKYIIDLNLI